MRRHRLYHIALLATVLLSLLSWSAPSVSLLFEARAAAHRSCQWLVARQRGDGSWEGDARLTARAVAALAHSGYGESDSVAAALAKALPWLATAPSSPANQPTAWEQRYEQAAALAAAEEAKAKLPDSQANWRTTLLEQALATQRGEGCWQEENRDSLAATVHALLVIGLAGGDELRQTGERQ
ncbi:MAG: hypothetical protein RBU25_10660 [Lentisphaeria bacterium]|jgi:hypothetical protein|nr:hypothetical protein [Lentisphaeria bacterium]